MDGGSSRIDPSSDNFDLLFKLIIIGDTGAAARSKCPGSQRLTRPPTTPEARGTCSGLPREERSRSLGGEESLRSRPCPCPKSPILYWCIMVKVAPWQRPCSPPAPPQGAPGGLGRRALPGAEVIPPSAQPVPRLLELTASKAANATTLTNQARASLACCTSLSSAPSRGARRTRSASSSALDSSRSAGRSSSCRFGTLPARSASARSPAVITAAPRARCWCTTSRRGTRSRTWPAGSATRARSRAWTCPPYS